MLKEQEIQSFKDNGYVLARGLIDLDFVAELRREADVVLDLANAEGQSTDTLWKGDFIDDAARAKQKVSGIHDMQFHSAVFARLIMYAPLLDAIEGLIGPNIHLHHTKLFVKPPREGGSFPLHQDYPYFPHAKNTMLAAIIHLDVADEENGCVRVMPGSHKKGLLDTEPGAMYLPPNDFPIEDATPCLAQPGDALIFNYLTIHGSGPNVSDRPRYTTLVQMRAAEDEPTVARHRSRGQGMMLRGVNPHYLPPIWAVQKAEAAAVAAAAAAPSGG
jgi:phytanoyl-CoA hydroxylase